MICCIHTSSLSTEFDPNDKCTIELDRRGYAYLRNVKHGTRVFHHCSELDAECMRKILMMRCETEIPSRPKATPAVGVSPDESERRYRLPAKVPSAFEARTSKSIHVAITLHVQP